MRSAAASGLVALVLLAAGCGGAEDETSASPPPAPAPPAQTTTATATEPKVGATDVGVFFVRDDKLGYATRAVGITPMIATAALQELLSGPTEAEREAGLATDVPPNTKLTSLSIKRETALVELSNPLDELGTAQVVQTLLQFETVSRVRLEGDDYLPTDIEGSLPAILVEAPAPGDTVSSPAELQGSANTFEATFMVEVKPEQGKPLLTDFVTATSGNGTRGTFAKTLDFVADRERPGMVVVYERSADDGSIVNRVEIPVTLRP